MILSGISVAQSTVVEESTVVEVGDQSGGTPMSSAGNGMNLRGNNRMRHHSTIPPSAAVANTQQQQIFCGSLWQQWPSGPVATVATVTQWFLFSPLFLSQPVFLAEQLSAPNSW